MVLSSYTYLGAFNVLRKKHPGWDTPLLTAPLGFAATNMVKKSTISWFPILVTMHFSWSNRSIHYLRECWVPAHASTRVTKQLGLRVVGYEVINSFRCKSPHPTTTLHIAWPKVNKAVPIFFSPVAATKADGNSLELQDPGAHNGKPSEDPGPFVTPLLISAICRIRFGWIAAVLQPSLACSLLRTRPDCTCAKTSLKVPRVPRVPRLLCIAWHLIYISKKPSRIFDRASISVDWSIPGRKKTNTTRWCPILS